ncbi:type VII toxin-antitoxin system MntA family adenylyltransferase antitoxin [Schnuerera ultunensis]|uniref:type VII toxin-antitoxin system MntA family adenylyltransferase antitoxin n=1 Tax=Schnuerera ultunensis TaxID=45497 RepID=UPI00041061D9|nr:nucleotidyltransferase domain-containing protein [Schnuerera ultunensis]
MLSESQLETLNKIFSKHKVVKGAYLFGSYAEGKENKFSDLDIGIILDEVYEKNIKIQLLKELSYNGFCNVDLVLLNEAPTMIEFEIVKHNKLIYRREDFNHPVYFSNIIRKGLDFKPLVKVQRKFYKERLLNGK